MSIHELQRFLPEKALPYLKDWFGDFYIHIKITKGRNTKLGDYRKMPDKSHTITINSTLEPQLFFFVLTHELAHMLAFEKYGRRIQPHGLEWKHTFRNMLIQSLQVYKDDLKPVILDFAKSPSANFMVSEQLVRYFHLNNMPENHVFLEDLEPGNAFIYNRTKYILIKKLKKNYLCQNLDNGREVAFKGLARVEKTNP